MTKQYSSDEVDGLCLRANELLADLSDVLAEIADRVSVIGEEIADGDFEGSGST